MKRIIPLTFLVLIFNNLLGCGKLNIEPIQVESSTNHEIQEIKEKVTLYTSPSGTKESCTILNKIPEGDYSKKDIQKESEYCKISFYTEKIALCPKTWSTSPATMIYDLNQTSYSSNTYEESQFCGVKKKADGVSTITKFKQTMNASGTSGTFSQSSLLYYHFSRYFDAKVKVPVAVYREMDKEIHKERVSRKGLRKASGAMNKAGWQHLYNAEEKTTSSYKPVTDLFTDDLTKIYGVLVDGGGERYGAELNGTRASGWGKGQNRDFQKTPAFLALRDSGDLKTAIANGLLEAKKDSKMRRDLVDISEFQMIFWMRELIEITLMDYIFSQQDRVGNIDYEWYWYYVADGEVKDNKEKRKEYKDLGRAQIDQIIVPSDLVAYSPLLIQRTNINDNDAGGRAIYVNFTESTKMLHDLKHYSAKTFKKLMDLNKDFKEQGPVYQWLINSIDLDQKNVSKIIENTKKAAELLSSQCSNIEFDLDDVEDYLIKGINKEPVDCLSYQ